MREPSSIKKVKPVRRIGKSGRAITGTLASYDGDEGSQYESTLERDFFLGLSLDPAVESVLTQPVTIHYRDARGKRRRYTPDALVRYLDERPPGLFEVKYVADVRENRLDLAPVFRAARAHARQQEMTFTLVTELSIRRPSLHNARFLRPYLRRAIPASLEQEVLALLAAQGATTPSALFAGLSVARRLELLPALWKLVARHMVAADLGVPLTMQSVIAPAVVPPSPGRQL